MNVYLIKYGDFGHQCVIAKSFEDALATFRSKFHADTVVREVKLYSSYALEGPR